MVVVLIVECKEECSDQAVHMSSGTLAATTRDHAAVRTVAISIVSVYSNHSPFSLLISFNWQLFFISQPK